MKLFELLDKLAKPIGLTDFPKVVVDQTNYHIGDIIRRNLAGEQVLGNQNLAYDYELSDKTPSDKVNPFSDMGFDLDDVIRVAKENGLTIAEMQNRIGEFKAELDKSKSVNNDKLEGTPEPSPAPTA